MLVLAELVSPFLVFPCHVAVRQVTARSGTESSALPHRIPYGAKTQSHSSRSGDGRLSFQLLGRGENLYHGGLKHLHQT